jgi:acetyl esterase/lipase
MYDMGSSFLLLKQLGASRAGTIGASLGGYLVALFVSLSRMAEVAALVVPLVSFQNLRLPTSILPGGTGNGKEHGALEKEVSALWKIHSPLSLSLKLDPERCLLIAAKGDRLCPFGDVQDLYEHWGKPRHLFLQGGHALFFPRSARGAAWYGFLHENGFVEGA